MRTTIQAEAALAKFLDSSTPISCPRTRCEGCNSSRHLYCPFCLNVFIPRDQWPIEVQNHSLRLPFLLDIILQDRHLSSTGLQLATVLQMAAQNGAERGFNIYDQEVENPVIPRYGDSASTGVYLLFPGRNSVPISSILKNDAFSMRTLVVLDCKWRATSVRLDPSLAHLQKVHLDDPPQESFFWRWHNKGKGMLSTVEAVYYAAWQIAVAQNWTLEQCSGFVQLLWLFSLQREIIRRSYDGDDKGYRRFTNPLPFSVDGKEYQRSLRRKQHNLKKLL